MNDDDIHIEPITLEMRCLANVIGSLRTAINRYNDRPDAKMGPQDGMDADICGVLGELAFAKWKHVYPDLSIGTRNRGFDSLVGKFRVDVKSTPNEKGRLLAVLKDNPDVDAYVLALVLEKENAVRFPGYAHKAELCQRTNVLDLKHGKGYAMEQGRLRKWGTKWSPE